MFDPVDVRNDFTVLSKEIEGKVPIYFDNACMTLKPKPVVDAITEYYNTYPGCGGRSAHKFALQVTMAYDETRDKLQRFLNAERAEEVIFTRNATEAINVVASGLCWLEKGDIILNTDKEHNSNLVPWHLRRDRDDLRHDVVPSNPDNTFNIENFKEKMSNRVKIVSMVQTSNLDGVTNPMKDIIEIAHDHGAIVLVDGCQSTPHQSVDVQAMDADFFAMSIHKMMGPTGMGALYGKFELLERLDPVFGGGDTVQQTSYEESKFLAPPERLEAGLQNYAGVIGTGAAVDYITSIGVDDIHAHEHVLNRAATKGLLDLGAQIIGPEDASLRSGILSFNLPGIDPHDISMFLDDVSNVMIRSGMHCVHSWFTARELKGSARASFYLYNTLDEVKVFIETVEQIRDMLGSA